MLGRTHVSGICTLISSDKLVPMFGAGGVYGLNIANKTVVGIWGNS